MITVVGPKLLSLPSTMGGNDTTFGLVLVAASRGLLVEQSGDTFQIAGITDMELLTLDVVRLLVGLGAEVLGYKVFFEFTDPKLDCPLFPGKPWSDAFGELHKPIQVADRFFQLNEVTQSPNDGEALPASMWINAKGITLRTLAEVQQLRAIQFRRM